MKKTGSTNHVRFTVSDIPRAEAFYDPLLRFMGYELAEKSGKRLAWKMPSPAGNRQWVILSAASEEGRRRNHDRYSPGLHHFAWNADSREEVDRFHGLLLERGVEVLDPPAEYDYEPGYYAVFFSDPDALKLELVHVPDHLEGFPRLGRVEHPFGLLSPGVVLWITRESAPGSRIVSPLEISHCRGNSRCRSKAP